MFVTAAVQLSSTADEEANWRQAESLIRRAAALGAHFIATPENTDFLGPAEEKARRAQDLDGPVCTRFSTLATELGVHLLLGSFAETGPEPGRCRNTSVLFGPGGERLAAYRKMHLFDVDLSDAVRFRESDTVMPGDDPAVVPTTLGTIGMSICYDLRFPGLYQELRARGAEILTVPSAFTLTTGRDHWHPLLRARAIETQCYVVAPAQHGVHPDASLRETYGHTMICDPWGAIVAEAPDGPGLAIAEIDLERVHRVRRLMPVLEHRRV